MQGTDVLVAAAVTTDESRQRFFAAHHQSLAEGIGVRRQGEEMRLVGLSVLNVSWTVVGLSSTIVHNFRRVRSLSHLWGRGVPDLSPCLRGLRA